MNQNQQKWYSIPTQKCLELLADAAGNQSQLKIAALAVGSGLNENNYEPDPTQTALKAEKYRTELTAIYIEPDNPNCIICEARIPPEIGGFYIREAGLFDEHGNLLAIAKVSPTSKPKEEEGSSLNQYIEFMLALENSAQVVLNIKEISQVAVQRSITQAVQEHAASVAHPYATAQMQGMVRLTSNLASYDHEAAATIEALQTAAQTAQTATTELQVSTSNAITNLEQNTAAQLQQLQDNSMPFSKAQPLPLTQDLNDLKAAGFYWIAANHTKPAGTNNYPVITGNPTNPNGALQVIKSGEELDYPAAGDEVMRSASYVQIFFLDYAHEIYVRHFRAWVSDWTPWQPLLNPTNINTFLPAGIPQPWPQNTPPAGWLVCDGTAFNRAMFPLLAQAYPSGRLPDLRGEFIRGVDYGRGVDVNRGALSPQAQQVAAHKHISTGIPAKPHGWCYGGQERDVSYDHGYKTGGGWWWFPFGFTSDGVPHDNAWHLNPAGLVGAENRPRNVAFLYIVRAA